MPTDIRIEVTYCTIHGGDPERYTEVIPAFGRNDAEIDENVAAHVRSYFAGGLEVEESDRAGRRMRVWVPPLNILNVKAIYMKEGESWTRG